MKRTGEGSVVRRFKVGDQVLIVGKVALDKDFGSGYNYPLLLEATSVTVKK